MMAAAASNVHALGAPALGCPRCGAPVTGAVPSPQACAGCRKPFVAVLGPLLDPNAVVPAPDARAGTFFLKWSLGLVSKTAVLGPAGMLSGMLDPIVGLAPMNQVTIGWPEVASITVWRTTAWGLAIAGPLCFVPFALLAAFVAMDSHATVRIVASLVALAFFVIPVVMVRHAIKVGHLNARVVGRQGVADVRLDRRLVVYMELFRRSGLVAPPQP